MTQLKSDAAETYAQSRQLQTDIAAAESSRVETERRLGDLQALFDRTASDLQASTDQIQHLTTETAALRDERTQLEAAVAALGADKARMAERLSAAERGCIEARGVCERLSRQLHDVVERSKKEIAVARRDAQQLNVDRCICLISQLARERDVAQQTAASALGQKEAAELEMERLRVEMAKLLKERDTAKQHLRQMTSAFASDA
jgi:chromosome segregation ATPase